MSLIFLLFISYTECNINTEFVTTIIYFSTAQMPQVIIFTKNISVVMMDLTHLI